MPHRLKGLGLEVKGRLLVTVTRGNRSMVIWLYTPVKQTTCLHPTHHSHVCARCSGAKLKLHVPFPSAPCSSLIFSSSHDLTQWTAFSEGHPHYTTLCVSVCMNAIQRFPQWGWFFFSSLKKEKGAGGGGAPSFPALGPLGQPCFFFFLPPSGSHLLLFSFCSQPMPRSTLYSTA